MLARAESLLSAIAEVASSLLQKLTWFVLLAVIAAGAWFYHWFTMDLNNWLMLILCLPVLIPLGVWLFILFVLHELKAAPELMHQLAQDEDGIVAQFSHLEDGIVAQFSHLEVDQPSSLRSLVSTVRTFREQDGLATVFDTISGLALFANPLFLIIACLMFLTLCGVILLAPLLLIF